MESQQSDKRFVKVIVAGFIIFLGVVIAYSFFMPVWIISSPHSTRDGNAYIDNTSYRANVSDEELNRMSILKEIDSKTFIPHIESEWQESLTTISETEWSRIKTELGVPKDDFILVTEKQAINIVAVHSFIPPSINSDRR